MKDSKASEYRIGLAEGIDMATSMLRDYNNSTLPSFANSLTAASTSFLFTPKAVAICLFFALPYQKYKM